MGAVPNEHADRTEPDEHTGSDHSSTRERRRLDGSLAERLDRLGPCRTTRRDHHREEGDHRPDDHSLDHHVRRHRDPAAGQGDADGIEHGHQHERKAEPGDHAERRTDDTDHQALETQRPFDLFGCGADRGQDGKLTETLRDDHAEGVVDDEPADEQRQQREALQGGLEHLAEATDLGLLVLEELRAGLHTEAGWDERLDRVDELGLAPGPSEVQVLVLVLSRVQPVERGGCRYRHRAARILRVGVTERRDAHDGRVELTGEREDGDLVTDVQVLVTGDTFVDCDLAGSNGSGAFVEVDRIEFLVLDPQSTRRRRRRTSNHRRRERPPDH